MYLVNLFKDAKVYGSIIDVKKCDFKNIKKVLTNLKQDKKSLTQFKYQNELNLLSNIISQAEILSEQFDIVITNPPYMGHKGMNDNLKNYLKSNYPKSKSDLYAVFIEKMC